MAWTVPRTWVPGELVTASMMNTHVRDNLNALRPSVETTALTGTQDDLALGSLTTFVRCVNVTPLTISGIAGGFAGRRILLFAAAGATVKFLHEGLTSANLNRISCASTRGQIINTRGWVELVYDDLSSRWRFASLDPGFPITPVHDSAIYTGSTPLTWTVQAADVLTFTYQQWGTVVKMAFRLVDTTTGGSPGTALQILMPENFGVLRASTAAVEIVNAGATPEIGTVQGSVTNLLIRRPSNLQWSAPTSNQTDVAGQVDVEVS